MFGPKLCCNYTITVVNEWGFELWLVAEIEQTCTRSRNHKSEIIFVHGYRLFIPTLVCVQNFTVNHRVVVEIELWIFFGFLLCFFLPGGFFRKGDPPPREVPRRADIQAGAEAPVGGTKMRDTPHANRINRNIIHVHQHPGRVGCSRTVDFFAPGAPSLMKFNQV